jgi:cytochrome d ubiquinol oxidase subunit I
MLRGRRDRYTRLGFLIPFTVASVVIPLQILFGDVIAREVFHKEPAKFAAIELVPQTGDHVPETLGGLLVDGKVRYGIDIPNGASMLSGFSPSTRIRGLDTIPPPVRPAPHLVNIVHLSFDVMVFTSFLLLGLSLWFAWAWWRRRDLPRSRWFLRLATVSGVVSVICLETGWIVTEVGRQPWTVVGLLLTSDAVTTRGNMWLFFAGVLVLYVAIGAGTIFVLRSMHHRWRRLGVDDVDVPYGPEPPLEQQPTQAGHA